MDDEITKCGQCPFWKSMETAEQLGFMAQEIDGHPVREDIGVCFATTTEPAVRCGDWPICGWMMQSYETERRHREIRDAINNLADYCH